MGFYLWVADDVAWAQGTYEYRPMGMAVVAVSDLFTRRDFDPRRKTRPPASARYLGQFASLGQIERRAASSIEIDIALRRGRVGVLHRAFEEFVELLLQHLAVRFFGFEVLAKYLVAARALALELGYLGGQVFDGWRFYGNGVRNYRLSFRVDLSAWPRSMGIRRRTSLSQDPRRFFAIGLFAIELW